MKSFFLNLWKDEQGAEMVEWAIVVGLVVIGAIAAYALMGTAVQDVTSKIATELTKAVG